MLYYHTHLCHFHPSPGFVAEPPSGRLPLHLCRAVCDGVAEATGRQRRRGAPRRLGAVRCPCSRSGGGEVVYAGHEDDMVHMGTPWVHHDTSNKACGYSMIFTHAHARFTRPSVHPWDDHRISSNQVGYPGMEDSEGITSRLQRSRAAQATADWLLQCQNLDGGFGCRPRECESHVPWAHMPRHRESPGRNPWELLSIIELPGPAGREVDSNISAHQMA